MEKYTYSWESEKRHWLKKDIEKYCKKILGWDDINIRYVPIKKTGVDALAHANSCTITFCVKSFAKEVLWHECGHLSANKTGVPVSSVPSLSKCGFWKEVNWRDVWHQKDFYEEELRAQAWAYLRALEFGYANIAKTLKNFPQGYTYYNPDLVKLFNLEIKKQRASRVEL
tara:strand:- start:54343 stop:54852 length:510 start_codon:yes stop_codon:yes gene_type:complete